jgi:uncharacterized protein (DUF2147 family)
MRIMLSAFTVALVSFQASAADPTGEWRVADGAAHIKIDDCGGRMWGIVSWAQQHGIDENNPDPAKRNRSTLGMPVILGMRPAQANRWEGEIYNAQNGKTYSGSITLNSPDVLRIEGCVLGFLCGGQTWTRVKAEPQAAAPSPGARKSVDAPRKAGDPPRKAGETTGSVKEVCSAVGAASGTTGSAHQRRLK